LRIHLSAAFRLLGELATETDGFKSDQPAAANLKAETVTAMATLPNACARYLAASALPIRCIT